MAIPPVLKTGISSEICGFESHPLRQFSISAFLRVVASPSMKILRLEKENLKVSLQFLTFCLFEIR